MVKGKRKDKEKKAVIGGEVIMIVQATGNNMRVACITPSGDMVTQRTAGGEGCRGAAKGTPYIARILGQKVGKEAYDRGARDVQQVRVVGIGSGREYAIRGLAEAGLNIREIVDKTPIPHNGCRPPLPRKQ